MKHVNDKKNKKVFFSIWVISLFTLMFLITPDTALAVYPAPWPSTWTAYTYLGSDINDAAKTDTPTDATYGTSVTPSAIDVFSGTSGTLASAYFAYDSTNQVLFFRERLLDTPLINDPYKNSGPYSNNTWDVVIDIYGDGWKDFVIEIDGNTGSQQDPYDDIAVFHNNAAQQSFNSDPCASGGDQVWVNDSTDGSSDDYDFGYTRVVDETASGGGYFIDMQIPLSAFKNCSGTQHLTEGTPFVMVFTTSATTQDPTQKDLVLEGDYMMASDKFIPTGDVGTLEDGLTQYPDMTDFTCSCVGNTMTLTAYTIDTLTLSGGNVVDTIDNVTFYYDDSGWQLIGTVTSPDTNTVNAWSVDWDTTGLSGSYPLRIVITDDQSNVREDLNWEADVDTCELVPTLVTLSSFNAYDDSGQVVVQWETSSEVGTVGFYLYRKDNITRKYQRVNHKLLPALLHSPQGGTYRYVDQDAWPGEIYTYKLVEVESSGLEHTYGPFRVTVKAPERHVSGKTMKPFSEVMSSSYVKKANEISSVKKNRLQILKQARNTSKPFMRHWTGDKVKIAVRVNGLYYLDASEIADVLGVPDISIKKMIKHNRLNLTNRGKRVAYLPAEGNEGIYLYAEGIDSIYTNENIYWLEKGTGLTMDLVKSKRTAPGRPGTTFTESIHVEEDHYALTALFTDPEADLWLWDYIISGDAAKTFTLETNGVAATGSATLTLHLKGGTNTDTSPDHHVVLSINGTDIGEDYFDGTTSHEFVMYFDQTLLNEGDNTIQVTGLLDTGAPYSIFYVDSFDLTYQRLYQAVDDRLFVRGNGNPVITIEGFSNPSIYVFDITNHRKPKFVTNTTVDEVSGSYRVSFRPTSPDALYLALTTDGLSTPVSVTAGVLSKLKNPKNRADYLVITPEELKDTAQGLADYRRAQGLKTKVITLEEIYDKFTYGIANPHAIRNFLSHAYHHWRKAPRYVLLVGDGTYDYKDNQGYGDNLVPPLMVNTPYGLFASDNRFADVKGNDGVPEMAIGRLPVVTSEELQALIDKIITYENVWGPWKEQVLMAADNPDEAGDFPADSNDIASLLPTEYVAQKIYLSEHPIDDARQLLLDGINNGALLLNYFGHAGLDRLADEGMLLRSDVPSLSNEEKLPVVTAMTCIAGRFSIPGYESLSEALVLKSTGGAVAVWAPTGLSINSQAKILNEGFFHALFQEGQQSLGSAVLRALEDYASRGGNQYILNIYNLIGDPVLQMR